MTEIDRREFFRLSAGAAAPLFATSLARALSIPASNRKGTIEDVEHVVIFMQENRSFDHYFGTLGGVRGFSDPRRLILPNGDPVWRQSDAAGNVTQPFRFDVENTSFPVMKSLDHSWRTAHEAWNEGRYDRWVPAKTALTMGHLARADIPYHFALADAFTVCDAYFSSIMGPTCPNRFYLMTGCVDAAGCGGGPIISNVDITQVHNGRVFGRGWKTFPERLQSAGIAWQAYRQGTDLSSDDDSDGGMNSLLAFEQYRSAVPGDPLYDRGVAPRRLDQLKRDVVEGKLAQVSWIYPPRLFCEHPKWPPAYGVEYIARIMDALTANPDVWSKTVFLIMYDENDGFFDHVVPPVPSLSPEDGKSTVPVDDERHAGDGKPFGLGMRVPMLAISPWSRGGWVCSEVFDHTSVIRFVEARFGVREDNITPWRRSVCGDLTSAFNFKTPNDELPRKFATIGANAPLPDQRDFDLYKAAEERKPRPSVPLEIPAPLVEKIRRRARPLPYDFEVAETLADGAMQLQIRNLGAVGAAFHVYDRCQSIARPKRYTVEAGKSLDDTWPLDRNGAYELALTGPNGFVRRYRGSREAPRLSVSLSQSRDMLHLVLTNDDTRSCVVSVGNAYEATLDNLVLQPRQRRMLQTELGKTAHWYDLSVRCGDFERQYAGHIETGKSSFSDPLLAHDKEI